MVAPNPLHLTGRAPVRALPVSRRVLAMLAATLVAAVLAVSLPAAPAAGAVNENFAVTPYSEPGPSGGADRANFVVEAAPGQTVTDRISVFNYTDEAMTFEVFGTDAYNTPVDGAFALRMPDGETGEPAPVEAVGAWLDVPVRTLVAQPGSRTDIPFTLTVPLDAVPGDHAGGIVALDTEARGGDGEDEDVAVAVKQALGVRVYVRVDGPLLPRFAVGDTELVAGGAGLTAPLNGPADAEARFLLTNTGNVTLSPTAQVRVTDLFGREVASVSLTDLPELLPRETSEQVVPLGDLGGFGPRHRLVVTVDALGVQSQGSTTAWTVPWLLLGLAVLALAVVLVLRWHRGRADGTVPADDAGTAAPGDDELVGASRP